MNQERVGTFPDASSIIQAVEEHEPFSRAPDESGLSTELLNRNPTICRLGFGLKPTDSTPGKPLGFGFGLSCRLKG